MPQGRLVIDVQIEAPAWRIAWPRAAADARRLLKAAALAPEIDAKAQGEVSVVFASDARLQALNARFRGKDRPTNVLSFENPAAPLGGIALAFETISREAKAQRKPFINHSKHLILHGFLHLSGYDHHTARSARLMEGLEIAILAAMGIPNPYLITRAKTRA
jgi:probable rRNA maturation factor